MRKEVNEEASRAGAEVSLDRPIGLEAGQTPNRKHVSLLFGDLVGSTETLAKIGDLKWMELVGAYYSIIETEYQRFGGRHLGTVGDGFLAAFTHAIDALNCASAILRGVNSLGLKIRIGIHAGECFEMGEHLVGLAVHVGARIAAAAAADEVLVSDSVKSQVTDSNLLFFDRGPHNLRGVPGEFRLFLAK
jgi:class 3 adenylate cyclase